MKISIYLETGTLVRVHSAVIHIHNKKYAGQYGIVLNSMCDDMGRYKVLVKNKVILCHYFDFEEIYHNDAS